MSRARARALLLHTATHDLGRETLTFQGKVLRILIKGNLETKRPRIYALNKGQDSTLHSGALEGLKDSHSWSPAMLDIYMRA